MVPYRIEEDENDKFVSIDDATSEPRLLLWLLEGLLVAMLLLLLLLAALAFVLVLPKALFFRFIVDLPLFPDRLKSNTESSSPSKSKSMVFWFASLYALNPNFFGSNDLITNAI